MPVGLVVPSIEVKKAVRCIIRDVLAAVDF
jgi:hypothetical protein